MKEEDMILRIHGTYPFDSYRWKRVSVVEHPGYLEQLLGVELDVDEKIRFTTGDLYLWLNKGYVLLGHRAPTICSGQAALFETMTDSEVGLDRIPPGTRAVYLHDGRYSLIETVA